MKKRLPRRMKSWGEGGCRVTAALVWKSLAVFLSSIFPIVECKGAVVLARILGVPHLLAGVLSAIGSFLPVPVVLYTQHGVRLGREQKKKGIPESIRKYVDRYGCLALLVIIAIPFTGMGCWLGAIVARVMHLDKLKAAVCIFIGNVIAVLVMTGCVHGVVTGFRLLM